MLGCWNLADRPVSEAGALVAWGFKSPSEHHAPWSRVVDPLGRRKDADPGSLPPAINGGSIGVWLSLVERSVRDREIGGSNPPTPTDLV